MGVINWSQHRRVVVLTGAGVSRASGLATFRDGDGLWEQHRIEDVATPEAFERDPQLVWRFYSMRRLAAGVARPNAAHLALARFARDFQGEFTLITQNVDGLHQRAMSEDTLCMHGSLEKSRCTHCGHVYWDDKAWLPEVGLPRDSGLLSREHRAHADALSSYNVKLTSGLPLSPCCQELLRPHIVWFGEEPFHLPRIWRALEEADVFLSLGTSGQVYPAAAFLEMAHGHKAQTYVLNLENLPQGASVDHFIPGPTEETAPRIFDLNSKG